MAVLGKSAEVTNYLAAPPVQSDAFYGNADLKQKIGTLQVLSTGTTADIYAFFVVPSNARMSSLEYRNEAVTTTGSFDIGVYTVDQKTGVFTAVSAALFASAVALTSASAAGTWVNGMEESGTITLANMHQRLWEQLSLTADPKAQYVIALTATDDTATTARVTMRCSYTV